MARGKLAARHNTYAIKIHWGLLKIPFQLYVCKFVINLDPAASVPVRWATCLASEG